MGRIVDFLGEVAAVADEGVEGLALSPQDRLRFHEDWDDEDINDALSLVHDSLLQGELVEAADSLCARLLEALGDYGNPERFARAAAGKAHLSIELIGQLARRVDRLEEVLALFREDPPPDRRGFDALRGRLADHGIEAEMHADTGDPGQDS
jgi:hypothetical protein